MKATLIVIENDADNGEPLTLVDKLMGSRDSLGQARMNAWLSPPGRSLLAIASYENNRCCGPHTAEMRTSSGVDLSVSIGCSLAMCGRRGRKLVGPLHFFAYAVGPTSTNDLMLV